MLNVKTAAVAGAMLLLSVGGSFAATISYDTKVLDAPKKWADVVQYADEGDWVNVIKCKGQFCYVKIQGPDGWVKKSAIDFGGYYDADPYPYNPVPVQACFWGKFGYVCV